MSQSQKRKLKFIDAVKEGLRQVMASDENVIVVGEGVPDPKSIFGSTKGLREEFGKDRVFDMPLSENAMTGILTGAAICGLRPVMIHQRIDFTLLALDQMINNAAKWHFMFNGKMNVPIVFRALIGRGWGQGPQHSQSLQSIFAHMPGLKVVMPVTPYDAKGLIISAVKDNNPVVYIDHRWCHGFEGEVPENMYEVPIGKARVARSGNDITLAGFSYSIIDAMKCAEVFLKYGISLEVIDMRSANPIDVDTLINSVKKTGRLIALDTGHKVCGLTSEILAVSSEKAHGYLKCAPKRVALPQYPSPTSFHLADNYFPQAVDIADAAIEMLNITDKNKINDIKNNLIRKGRKDVPDFEFKGPF